MSVPLYWTRNYKHRWKDGTVHLISEEDWLAFLQGDVIFVGIRKPPPRWAMTIVWVIILAEVWRRLRNA